MIKNISISENSTEKYEKTFHETVLNWRHIIVCIMPPVEKTIALLVLVTILEMSR
jgi:hypothetical protein